MTSLDELRKAEEEARMATFEAQVERNMALNEVANALSSIAESHGEERLLLSVRYEMAEYVLERERAVAARVRAEMEEEGAECWCGITTGRHLRSVLCLRPSEESSR
jgi:hypothetical protein